MKNFCQLATRTKGSRFMSLRCCFAGVLLFAAANVLGSSLSDGLQVYYPFTEAADGAFDASGNGRHGGLTGTTWVNEGHPAGSRHLGPGSYINAGNAVNFASWEQYSISIWFRHDTSIGDETGYGDKLFCKSAMFSDQYIRMLPSRSEYADRPGSINFTVGNGVGGFSLECRDDFRDNVWHHLAIVRNGSHAEMWVDGVSRKSCEIAITVADNTQPICLGYSPSPDDFQRRYWPGDIDEFRIYNRALSNSELQALSGTHIAPVSFEISSLHGTPQPSAGTHALPYGINVTASVDRIIADTAETRYVCSGWTGSGSLPAAGDTNRVSFTITNNSTLAWQWRAEHQVTLTAVGGGSVSGEGWFEAGATATISASAGAGHRFLSWSDGNPEASRSVSVPVGGLSLSAEFEELPTGTLRFAKAAYSVEENAANTVIRLTVQRVGGANGPASVTCAIAGLTATESEDYFFVNNTLSWADGDAASKTLTIMIIDDAVYESDETFIVTLTDATGATIGSPATSAVTILDNDKPLDWENGCSELGGGWRRLAWFGDYVRVGLDGWVWHNKHGFIFIPPTATPTSIWMYTQDMGWLWTSQTTYPFLFRPSDGAWLWYSDSVTPRWFLNMQTGQWERW